MLVHQKIRCVGVFFLLEKSLSSISASAPVQSYLYQNFQFTTKMLHLYSNQGSSEVLSAKKSEKYSSVFEYMLKRLKIQQTEVKNFLPFVQVIQFALRFYSLKNTFESHIIVPEILECEYLLGLQLWDAERLRPVKQWECETLRMQMKSTSTDSSKRFSPVDTIR